VQLLRDHQQLSAKSLRFLLGGQHYQKTMGKTMGTLGIKLRKKRQGLSLSMISIERDEGGRLGKKSQKKDPRERMVSPGGKALRGGKGGPGHMFAESGTEKGQQKKILAREENPRSWGGTVEKKTVRSEKKEGQWSSSTQEVEEGATGSFPHGSEGKGCWGKKKSDEKGTSQGGKAYGATGRRDAK